MGLFTQATYPQVVSSVQLFDHFQLLKDAKGDVLNVAEPSFLNSPTIHIEVLVPVSAKLSDGTIEGVSLGYVLVERDRVKNALVEKFGASRPPEKKVSPEEMKFWGLISEEFWETGWGELSLMVTDKFVAVIAKTAKLIRFEQENKKDEF